MLKPKTLSAGSTEREKWTLIPELKRAFLVAFCSESVGTRLSCKRVRTIFPSPHAIGAI